MRLTKLKAEEDRSAKVVEFIRNHQGCNFQALVNGVENYMSRVTAYNTVHSLEKVGVIRAQKDKPNSRDHKLFVTTDNLLVSIPQELNEFEKSYLKLLDKSKERIRKKDFSPFVKKLQILGGSDLSKWSEAECDRYTAYEIESMEEQNIGLFGKMVKIKIN